jgi:hypothetical protein
MHQTTLVLSQLERKAVLARRLLRWLHRLLQGQLLQDSSRCCSAGLSCHLLRDRSQHSPRC